MCVCLCVCVRVGVCVGVWMCVQVVSHVLTLTGALLVRILCSLVNHKELLLHFYQVSSLFCIVLNINFFVTFVTFWCFMSVFF